MHNSSTIPALATVMNPATADFPSFLESLKAPDSRTALSPDAMARALELPIQGLANLAGVHRNTLSSKPTSPKLQAAMVDINRVLSAATELTGSVDRALFWFRNHPISEFDHFTAMQLVEKGKAQAVVDYIESISGGAAG